MRRTLFYTYAFQLKEKTFSEEKFAKEFKRFHNRVTLLKKENKSFSGIAVLSALAMLLLLD
jgi:hypothetical protein